MTKEEREAFKKNIRKPKNIVNQSGVTTTIGPDFNKDGTIKRTYKQKKEDMSKTPGVLPKVRDVEPPVKPVKTEVKKPKKLSTRQNPLKDKPRSISAARASGSKYFWDKKGVKKLAVTGEELKKKGLTLKQWANKFAKKKHTKKETEALKPYHKDEKLKKNPANKRYGGTVRKMRGGGLATRGTSFSIY